MWRPFWLLKGQKPHMQVKAKICSTTEVSVLSYLFFGGICVFFALLSSTHLTFWYFDIIKEVLPILFIYLFFESKWKRTGEGGIEIQRQWKHTTEQHTSLMQNIAPARNVNIMKSIKKVTTVCPGTPTWVALLIILFFLYKIQHLRILMFWQFGDKTRITLQCTEILQYG